MSTKVSRFLTLGFVFSIALVLVFSPLTQAIGEISLSDFYPQTVYFGNGFFCTDASLPNSVNYTTGKCDSVNNKYWRQTGQLRIESNGSTTPWAFGGFFVSSGARPIEPGYLQIPIYIINGEQSFNMGQVTGFMANPKVYYNVGDYLATVDSKFENLNGATARVTVTVYHDWVIPANTQLYFCSNSQTAVAASQNPYAANAVWSRGLPRFGVIIGNGTNFFYGDDDSGSSFDDTEILNHLYTMGTSLSSIDSKISSMSGNSQQMLDAINDLNDETNQANQDANARYQDEKDTINDSKDEAQNSADSMDTSGFSLGNPFASWFGMFTNNNCVDIPKIASWIHSNETRVCSPWSSDVRSNLTPIISVIAVMVGFGLLVHWLKGDTDVGLENT